MNEVAITRDIPGNRNKSNYFLLDSEFISSKIHARIRFQETTRQFQIATFNKYPTKVGEKEIRKSDPDNPEWVNFSPPARITLNTKIVLDIVSKV
jgi:hypothetical protein